MLSQSLSSSIKLMAVERLQWAMDSPRSIAEVCHYPIRYYHSLTWFLLYSSIRIAKGSGSNKVDLYALLDGIAHRNPLSIWIPDTFDANPLPFTLAFWDRERNYIPGTHALL